ncbi:PIT1 [Zea mays]|nr:PIT1 [Zea mays]
MPPKKTPVVETAVTISEHEDMQSLESREGLSGGAGYTRCSYTADQCATWCRSLAITFTIMLLAWHLVAVVTVEAAAHCAFSLLAMYLLRAAGILLPLCVVMRLIRIVQSGQEQQYGLQLLEHQRRNVSTI